MKALAIGLLAALAVVVGYSIYKNAKFNELLNRAEALADTVSLQRDSLIAVQARTEQMLDRQRDEIMDSIAAIPRTRPSDAPETFRVVLDTVPLPPELTAAGRELLAYVGELETERDQLRVITDGIPQLLAQRDSIWAARESAMRLTMEAMDRENAALKEAVEAASSGAGWTERLLFALGGAVLWEVVRE